MSVLLLLLHAYAAESIELKFGVEIVWSLWRAVMKKKGVASLYSELVYFKHKKKNCRVYLPS